MPEDFLEGEESRQRFEREARLLAALNHPGIAAIYSFEEVPGPSPSSSRHILVMELIEGVGLDQKIGSGPLPLEESLPLARQIAEALEAALEKSLAAKVDPFFENLRSDPRFGALVNRLNLAS